MDKVGPTLKLLSIKLARSASVAVTTVDASTSHSSATERMTALTDPTNCSTTAVCRLTKYLFTQRASLFLSFWNGKIIGRLIGCCQTNHILIIFQRFAIQFQDSARLLAIRNPRFHSSRSTGAVMAKTIVAMDLTNSTAKTVCDLLASWSCFVLILRLSAYFGFALDALRRIKVIFIVSRFFSKE